MACNFMSQQKRRGDKLDPGKHMLQYLNNALFVDIIIWWSSSVSCSKVPLLLHNWTYIIFCFYFFV